jgi:hypothetical protein
VARTVQICVFVGVMWGCLCASGETVRFTNGASVRGSVKRQGAYVVVRTQDGRALRVKSSLVESIVPDGEAAEQRGPSKGAPGPAAPQAACPGEGSSLAEILNRPMTVEFQQMPLAAVVQYLRTETGLNFVIDPDIKADEITITLSLKDMKLINILRWIAEVGKLAIVIKGDSSSTVRIAGLRRRAVTTPRLECKPERLALYDVRPLLLSATDRPAQPFNLPEGRASSSPMSQAGPSGQGVSPMRSAKGRDTQDIDLQRRGHDLVELLVRTTGTANWDNAFVFGRLPERDYLAGE